MTQTAAADAPTIWAPAIRQRRKAMMQRIVMGAATALVFSPMLGWRFSGMWLVIYTLIQFWKPRSSPPSSRARSSNRPDGAGSMAIWS